MNRLLEALAFFASLDTDRNGKVDRDEAFSGLVAYLLKDRDIDPADIEAFLRVARTLLRDDD